MKLEKRVYRGKLAWYAVFGNGEAWLVGRCFKLPTVNDAMRIVHQWKVTVVSGVPTCEF